MSLRPMLGQTGTDLSVKEDTMKNRGHAGITSIDTRPFWADWEVWLSYLFIAHLSNDDISRVAWFPELSSTPVNFKLHTVPVA